MKRWRIGMIGLLMAGAVMLGGCRAGRNTDERVEEFMSIADRAVSVTAYYGYQCYSYYKEDQESVEEVADLFRNMELEETEETVDQATAFTVYFVVDDETSASLDVDQNGVIWLAQEKKFYKDRSGTFDYGKLADIYIKSGGNMDPNASCELYGESEGSRNQ